MISLTLLYRFLNFWAIKALERPTSASWRKKCICRLEPLGNSRHRIPIKYSLGGTFRYTIEPKHMKVFISFVCFLWSQKLRGISLCDILIIFTMPRQNSLSRSHSHRQNIPSQHSLVSQKKLVNSQQKWENSQNVRFLRRKLMHFIWRILKMKQVMYSSPFFLYSNQPGLRVSMRRFSAKSRKTKFEDIKNYLAFEIIFMSHWFVRAWKGAESIETFINDSFVGMNWDELWDLSNLKTIDEISTRYAEIYPDAKTSTRSNHVRQINKFVHEFQIWDDVVTYDRDKRMYHVGKITGHYEFLDSSPITSRRSVLWSHTKLRDGLQESSTYSLGALSTIFAVNDEVFQDLIGTTKASLLKHQSFQEELIQEQKEGIVIDQAYDLVQKKILMLRWDQMQELVAGILRAMGYKTRISPQWSDLGKDIIASPDWLGLADPRIMVEVKHRKNSMDAPEIRNFVSTLRTHLDRWMYVSTWGFTKEARYEAERSSNPVTLINLTDLTDLVISYYDQFDAETIKLLPLKKIYVPEFD